MSISTHPFIKYGIAVVLRENNLSNTTDISRQHLIREIENCVNHFRMQPETPIDVQKTIKFVYCNEESGNPSKGIYLSPTILCTDKSAKQVYSALHKIKTELQKDKPINVDISRSMTPIVGEFTSFGINTIGRGSPKAPIEVASFCMITTSTEKKPSLAYRTIKKDKTERENVSIIPDLEIEEMIDFINLFEKMREQSTDGLMYGFVSEKDKKPQRPRLFDGNFPHAPKSSALGIIGLLGAIGSWAKDAEMID